MTKGNDPNTTYKRDKALKSTVALLILIISVIIVFGMDSHTDEYGFGVIMNMVRITSLVFTLSCSIVVGYDWYGYVKVVRGVE